MTKIEDSSFAQSNFKTHSMVDLIKKVRFVWKVHSPPQEVQFNTIQSIQLRRKDYALIHVDILSFIHSVHFV